jgi:putative ATP-binding cassette transporter
MVDPGMSFTAEPQGLSRVAALMTRFQLKPPDADSAHWPPERDLGDAERIRAAIVATELEDRPIRLYDERAICVEPRFRDAFAETLREARSRGRTCVIATADPTLIALADRVFRMEDGLLVAPTAAVR